MNSYTKTHSGTFSELARGSISAFMVSGAERVLGLFVQVMLAKCLTPKEYGQYSYTIILVNILGMMGLIGIYTPMLRFISSFNSWSQWEKMRGLLISSNLFGLTTTLGLTFISEFLLLIFSKQIDPSLRQLLQIGALIIPIVGLSNLREASLRGLKFIITSRIFEAVVNPIILLVGIGIFSWKQSATPLSILVIYIGAIVLSFVAGNYLLLRIIPSGVRLAISSYNIREIMAVSVPMFFVSTLQIILNRADIFFLGYLGTMTDVAIYNVSSQVSHVASFGLLAVMAIAAPLISEAFTNKDYIKLQHTLSLSALFTTLYYILFLLGILLFGKSILGLFGDSYISSLYPLFILLLGQLVNSFAGPVSSLLTMTGYHRYFLYILICSVLIHIILSIILIPTHGIIGASVATTISNGILSISASFFAIRLLNINPTIINKNFFDYIKSAYRQIIINKRKEVIKDVV